MDRTKTITIGDVCEIICKHCVKAHGRCLHKWDCPLLTEIAKYIDRKTENSSEKPNNCEVSEIPTGSIISKMEQVDEPERNMAEDIVESFGFKAESYRQAKAKTEQTERSE